jgi:hypothetical protein
MWTGMENLAPLELDPWTTQPVESHMADYAFPAHQQLPLFYSNLRFVTVDLEILSLSLSGVMAVLQVFVIFLHLFRP